jgi:pyruvate dehydrogenase E1 component alpha subunit
MEESGEMTDEAMSALDAEVKQVVEDAWNFADASPEPALESLYEDVTVETST